MSTREDRLTTLVAQVIHTDGAIGCSVKEIVHDGDALLSEIEKVCATKPLCPVCEKKLSKVSDWEQVKISNAVNAEHRVNEANATRLSMQLQEAQAECAKLRALAEKTMRERDEARDCGQEGVCAIAPGCQRHWADSNREIVASYGQREVDRLTYARDAFTLGKYEQQVDAWRQVVMDAVAVERERCAKVVEEFFDYENQSLGEDLAGKIRGPPVLAHFRGES